jgi:hypothetical protein
MAGLRLRTAACRGIWQKRAGIREFWGIDVDAEAIRSAAARLPGHYQRVSTEPPTTLPANSFDVVCACSVFMDLLAVWSQRLPGPRGLEEVVKPPSRHISRTDAIAQSDLDCPFSVFVVGAREVFVQGGGDAAGLAAGPGPFEDFGDSWLDGGDYAAASGCAVLSAWGDLVAGHVGTGTAVKLGDSSRLQDRSLQEQEPPELQREQRFSVATRPAGSSASTAFRHLNL